MTTPITPPKTKRIGIYFHVSILVKGAFSVVEIIGGLLALIIPPAFVTHVLVRLAQGELVEDPTDFIGTHLVRYAHQISLTGNILIAAYLLSRGIIKLSLVIALWKNKLWAYPASLVVLGIFVVYQVYQIATGFSGLLTILTIFDLFVLWSIWAEYRAVRSRLLL